MNLKIEIIFFTHRFWKYGQAATDGLMQVAEQGSTRELESELKSKVFFLVIIKLTQVINFPFNLNQSGEIRTIIKAKGLAFPNVTGKTFAVFRVDPTHSNCCYPGTFLGKVLPNCENVFPKKVPAPVVLFSCELLILLPTYYRPSFIRIND